MKSIALFGLGLFAAALIWWLAPVGGEGQQLEGVGPNVSGANLETVVRTLPQAPGAPIVVRDQAQRAVPTLDAAETTGQREGVLEDRDLLLVVDTTGTSRAAVVRASWPGTAGSEPEQLRLEVTPLGLDLAQYPGFTERLDQGLSVALSVKGDGLVDREFGPDELREVPGGRTLEVERLVSLTYRIDLNGGDAVLPGTVQRSWIGRDPGRSKRLRKSGSSFRDGVPESWLPTSFVLEAEGYVPKLVEVPALEPVLVEVRERAHPAGAKADRAILDLGVLQLEPTNPSLSGRLLLSAGQPLAFADYTLKGADGYEVALGRTGADGSFRIRGLPAGLYDLELRLPALGDLGAVLPRAVEPGPQGDLLLPFDLVELTVQAGPNVQALKGWPGAYWLRAVAVAPGQAPLQLGKWKGMAEPSLRFLVAVTLDAWVHALGESPLSSSEIAQGAEPAQPLRGSRRVSDLPTKNPRTGTLVIDLAESGTLRLVVRGHGDVDWRFELTAVDTGLEGGLQHLSLREGLDLFGPQVGQTLSLASGVWRAQFVETDHPESSLQPAVDELEFTLAPGEDLVIDVPVVTGGRIQLDVVNEFTGSSWDTILRYELLRAEPGAAIEGPVHGGEVDEGVTGAAGVGAGWERLPLAEWFVERDGQLEPGFLRKDRTRRFVSQALRPGTYRLVVPDRLDETFEIAPDGLVTLQVSMD